ncbi:TIGR04211 family SH3 domain-containing protein [Shewanella xiamenensis]|uniref:TIGR04211 family SH3 domain-containing protein n=2 Tax=Shewanella xiamenensis TaxID=332186 RepID=A0AAW6QYT1_9GAMM|nr:TIGR04211 family SH3 domain-containing protein [Shewanella xiamenensis]PHY62374.1 TIGR04211 family SH3 domain-containing protein [Shewanella xiamenensis]PZP32622.1 MAG: TIGR04211 family SH3 domain-containing protein [Shewanella oneidensis]BDQ64985.1 SH3 domain protein [Shewanella xiamenensis]GLD76120.1 SH3 domain protein [Shewanella xiamenensis]
MLRMLTLVGMMLLSPNLLAEGQPRYISDNVFLYILNGPGTDYRILGSIEAGQPVTLLGETQGDYSKIIDHKGREGWVPTNLISSTPSFREQVSTLTNELNETKAKLAEVLSSTNNHSDEVDELKAKLSEAEAMLNKTTQERDNLKVAVDRSAQEAQFALWREGGLIAAAGLVVGVILVYLPRPQRRNKKRWM